jgi:mannose/fructose/N-acetylgalactosamine-specific phosphotransferase system component IID
VGWGVALGVSVGVHTGVGVSVGSVVSVTVGMREAVGLTQEVGVRVGEGVNMGVRSGLVGVGLRVSWGRVQTVDCGVALGVPGVTLGVGDPVRVRSGRGV